MTSNATMWKSGQLAESQAETPPDEVLFTKQGSPLRWMARLPTFSSLAYRDYAWLWMSNFFSGLGQWMQQVSVGWITWEMTHSPLVVGLSTAMRFVPVPFIVPLSGVLSDRLDKRRVIQTTQLFLTAVTLGFAILVALHAVKVWHVYVFSFLIGAGFQLNKTARQSWVGFLVPRSAYHNAFAVNSLSGNITRAIGPAVGGMLIALIGNTANFFILVVLFVMEYLMLVPINPKSNEKVARGERSVGLGAITGEFTDGLRYLKQDMLLTIIILMSFVAAMFVQPMQQIMPAFAVDVLGGGPVLLGLLQSAFAIGAGLASFSIASFKIFQHRSIWLMGSLVPQTLALVVFSQSSVVWLAVLMLVVSGFFQMWFNVNNLTQTQMLAPEHMRGRIASFNSMTNTLQPLGAALMGALAEWMGVQSGLALCGGIGFIFAIYLSSRYGKISVPEEHRLGLSE